MAVLGNVDDDISQAPQIIQSGTEAVTKEKSCEVNLSDPLGSKRSKYSKRKLLLVGKGMFTASENIM